MHFSATIYEMSFVELSKSSPNFANQQDFLVESNAKKVVKEP